MNNSIDNKNLSGMDYLAMQLKKSGATVVSDDSHGSSELGTNDKQRISTKINLYIKELDTDTMSRISHPEVQERVSAGINEIAEEEKEGFPKRFHVEIDEIVKHALDSLFGYGAIQNLHDDLDVTEIMVNGKGEGKIFYEKNGKIYISDTYFTEDDQIMNVINQIVAPINRRIDESSPMVDARLPNGSRVNAIIPPIAIDGPTVTIRKFKKGLTMQKLISSGSVSEKMAILARACVIEKVNLIIIGGTGSGKTTILNALSEFIPSSERIITIEDSAELSLMQNHVIRLESRPKNIEGKGEITIRECLRNALRMRPDRIVVGEVRDAACSDMLNAMNTGHEGSLTTAHANSAEDSIVRMEDMCQEAGLAPSAARRRILASIDAIVEVKRSPQGKRYVACIAGLEKSGLDDIIVRPIINYDPNTGITRASGYIPLFANKIIGKHQIIEDFFNIKGQ